MGNNLSIDDRLRDLDLRNGGRSRFDCAPPEKLENEMKNAVWGFFLGLLVSCAGGEEEPAPVLEAVEAPFTIEMQGTYALWAKGGTLKFSALGEEGEVLVEVRMMAHTKTRALRPGDTWEPFIPLGVHELVVEPDEGTSLFVKE